jgi:hypothetical protein
LIEGVDFFIFEFEGVEWELLCLPFTPNNNSSKAEQMANYNHKLNFSALVEILRTFMRGPDFSSQHCIDFSKKVDKRQILPGHYV